MFFITLFCFVFFFITNIFFSFSCIPVGDQKNRTVCIPEHERIELYTKRLTFQVLFMKSQKKIWQRKSASPFTKAKIVRETVLCFLRSPINGILYHHSAFKYNLKRAVNISFLYDQELYIHTKYDYTYTIQIWQISMNDKYNTNSVELMQDWYKIKIFLSLWKQQNAGKNRCLVNALISKPAFLNSFKLLYEF